MLIATFGGRQGFKEEEAPNLGFKGLVRSGWVEGEGERAISVMCQVENEVRRSGQRGGPHRGGGVGNEVGTRKEAHGGLRHLSSTLSKAVSVLSWLSAIPLKICPVSQLGHGSQD